MDVHVNDINSTVRATDTQTLLNPQLLNQIVKAVLERLREEQAHEQRIANERNVRSNMLTNNGADW